MGRRPEASRAWCRLFLTMRRKAQTQLTRRSQLGSTERSRNQITSKPQREPLQGAPYRTKGRKRKASRGSRRSPPRLKQSIRLRHRADQTPTATSRREKSPQSRPKAKPTTSSASEAAHPTQTRQAPREPARAHPAKARRARSSFTKWPWLVLIALAAIYVYDTTQKQEDEPKTSSSSTPQPSTGSRQQLLMATQKRRKVANTRYGG